MLKEKYIKRMLTAFTIMIITGVICLFGLAFYKTITVFQGLSISNKQISSNKPSDDYNKTGKEIIEKSDKDKKDITKNTRLNLSLLGTVTTDRKSSYAIISDNSINKQSFCRIGDKIGGAVVKEILRKKVILIFNNNEEILTLKEQMLSHENKNQNDKQDDMAIQKANAAKEYYKPLLPLMEDGKFKGVKINNKNLTSLFSKMSLNNDDIIIGINGKNFNSFEEISKTFQEEYKYLLETDKEKEEHLMTWQVLRNGKIENIDFNADLIVKHYKGADISVNSDTSPKE